MISEIILEQINKELAYAEIRHTGQVMSREETIDIALKKIQQGWEVKQGHSACNNVACDCTDCSDTDKWVCSMYATIAIIIRGIQAETDRHVATLYDNRNKIFDELLNPKKVTKKREYTCFFTKKNK